MFGGPLSTYLKGGLFGSLGGTGFGSIVVGGVIEIVGDWILLTAFWDDTGVWKDTESWTD